MQRGSPVHPAMQAADAAHSGRGGRLLLRYVRVQMTFVSNLRSEASEVTASAHLIAAVLFVQRVFPPPGLRWSVKSSLPRWPPAPRPAREEHKVRYRVFPSPRLAAASTPRQTKRASPRAPRFAEAAPHAHPPEHRPASPSGSTAAP